MKTIRLKRGKSESLRRYHPWVFSGAIARKDNDLREGDIVKVLDEDDRFIATGHYQIGSIAVRVLSFEEREIDHDFWQSRLHEAYRLRKALGLAGNRDNDIYRLVHGEGDRLPGLVVDVYGKTAVVQAHSVGMPSAARP